MDATLLDQCLALLRLRPQLLRPTEPGYTAGDVRAEVERDLRGWVLSRRDMDGSTGEQLWNAYVADRHGIVRLSHMRCRTCRGQGFDVRQAHRGSPVCRSCVGRRSVTVPVHLDPVRPSPLPG